MERVKYFVTYYQGQWWIDLQGTRHGPYDTQYDAIHYAVAAARKTLNSQVLEQGQNNQFRTEWTYGDDPYPPKG